LPASFTGPPVVATGTAALCHCGTLGVHQVGFDLGAQSCVGVFLFLCFELGAQDIHLCVDRPPAMIEGESLALEFFGGTS